MCGLDLTPKQDLWLTSVSDSLHCLISGNWQMPSFLSEVLTSDLCQSSQCVEKYCTPLQCRSYRCRDATFTQQRALQAKASAVITLWIQNDKKKHEASLHLQPRFHRNASDEETLKARLSWALSRWTAHTDATRRPPSLRLHPSRHSDPSLCPHHPPTWAATLLSAPKTPSSKNQKLIFNSLCTSEINTNKHVKSAASVCAITASKASLKLIWQQVEALAGCLLIKIT